MLSKFLPWPSMKKAITSNSRKGNKLYANRLFTAISLGGMMIASLAQANPPLAWLEINPVPTKSNIIQIKANALAFEAIKGADFSLAIQRQNHGNHSNVKQAGRFDLPPNEIKMLATTSINIEPGDDILVELTVSDNGRELFKATLLSHADAQGQTL